MDSGLSARQTSQTRVTMQDGEVVVLRDPVFFGDSIRGFAPPSETCFTAQSGAEECVMSERRVTIPMSRIQGVETWDVDGLRTLGAVIAGAAFVAGAALLVGFFDAVSEDCFPFCGSSNYQPIR